MSFITPIQAYIERASPYLFPLSWVNFFKKLRTFFKAKNKNLSGLLDLAQGFASTLQSSVSLVIVITALSGLASALPYLLGAILLVGMLKSLYKVFQNVLAKNYKALLSSLLDLAGTIVDFFAQVFHFKLVTDIFSKLVLHPLTGFFKKLLAVPEKPKGEKKERQTLNDSIFAKLKKLEGKTSPKHRGKKLYLQGLPSLLNKDILSRHANEKLFQDAKSVGDIEAKVRTQVSGRLGQRGRSKSSQGDFISIETSDPVHGAIHPHRFPSRQKSFVY